jgi:DNA-3-methyladenine glycosylase II
MTVYETAAKHLSEHDPLLAPIIARAGVTTIRPHTDYYQALVSSVISQQLSVKAAATIKQRLRGLFGAAELPAPEQILTKNIEELRSVGLSRGKAMYIQDLAVHVLDGSVDLEHFADKSNEEIIKELVAVKGIGEWTAHMFLIFAMGRLDVLATGDLGIRNGMRALYGLDHAPSPEEMHGIALRNQWHPYESIACWYVWRSLENEPEL